MDSTDRLKALLIVWGSFALAAGLSFVGNQETGTNDRWLAVIFAGVALIGSMIVMRMNIPDNCQSARAFKPKRGVYSMIDDLDEQELAALRSRLAILDQEASGEAAPL